MKLRRALAAGAVAMAMAMATSAQASQIIYNLSFSGPMDNLAGMITTDGTIGGIFAANIVAWSFTETGTAPHTLSSADAGSGYQCFGTSGCFTATATTLSFNFGTMIANDPFANFESLGSVVQFTATIQSAPGSQILSQSPGSPGSFPRTVQHYYGPTSDQIGAAAPVAVPEPASWALMIGGFGLAGGMLRRRRMAVA